MDVRLSIKSQVINKTIAITGSKSETNRLLLLKALYPGITIENASQSDDSDVMMKALSSQKDSIDVHHAGTAMRFLTAYFAIKEGREVVLTGSDRMKERPIGVLVSALRSLGAGIEYLENDGYPPLKITGKALRGGLINIKADVSSQYISALLLIAPKLQEGLELTLEGEITSRPYIDMTLALLNQAGIEAVMEGKIIKVKLSPVVAGKTFVVESDWSSAGYYYSIIALSKTGTAITLKSYKENSLQGDSVLVNIYQKLGVSTVFGQNSITLKKEGPVAESLIVNLNNTPDIAQTIAVTCFGLGVGCELNGLHTLKIKETDRLAALRQELTKFGAQITVTDDALLLKPSNAINQEVQVNTYNDHRMALAFAPLAVTGTTFIIKEAEVVSKSYPHFWEDLKVLGFNVEQL